MLPIAFIAGFCVSAVLLIFALRGRRVGDEPRCRKCRYNLTGAVSQHCPECGTPITPRTIRWGLRRPRMRLAGLAVVLIGLQGTLLYTTFTNKINWYWYYPHSLLVRCAQRGDNWAIVELHRRLPSLSAAQAQQLADVALNIRAQLLAGVDAGKLPANYREWDFLLVPLANLKLLRPDQRETYKQQYFAFHGAYAMRPPPIAMVLPLIRPPFLSQEDESVGLKPIHEELARLSIPFEFQHLYGRPVYEEVARRMSIPFVDQGRPKIRINESFMKPQRPGLFDGIGWDMKFDPERNRWIPADRSMERP